MAPDERRAALVAATLPLIKEFGAGVSTRQIADAAGVAEGTIFGVFPDKASLLRATVLQAMNPDETIRAVEAIDRTLNLRTRLEQATAILLERTALNVALMTSLGRAGLFQPPPPDNAPQGGGAKGGAAEPHGPPREFLEARERMVDAVVALVGPDARLLRRSPAFLVNLLVSIVFVAGRGGFGFTPAISAPDEIVSLLLDGLLRTPDPSRDVQPYTSKSPEDHRVD